MPTGNHYELKEMNADGLRTTCRLLLNELEMIEVEDLTTFELRLLRALAADPPKQGPSQTGSGCRREDPGSLNKEG